MADSLSIDGGSDKKRVFAVCPIWAMGGAKTASSVSARADFNARINAPQSNEMRS